MTLHQRACFVCRKCFKKQQAFAEPSKCPQCAGPLFTMGTAFRAPKQSDVAQWQKAEQLVHSGFLFRRNAGPRPYSFKGLPEFLEARRIKTKGERLVQRSLVKKATAAKSQGRVTQIELDGKIEFTLAGRPLKSWCTVEVKLKNAWVPGVFRNRATPHIRTGTGEIVLREPNTVCRWPSER